LHPIKQIVFLGESVGTHVSLVREITRDFRSGVPRPSNVLGQNYNRLAYLVAHQLDLFLRHDETAEETVCQIEDGAKKLLHDSE